MDTLSTTAADATRDKEVCPQPAPSVVVSDSMSSYQDYPAHRPFVNTLVHHTPTTRTRQSYGSLLPSKALPETNSPAILSALRNLQEKIRKLELEKAARGSSLLTKGKDVSNAHIQGDGVTHGLKSNETSDKSSCNQALVTHLAAAESRCMKLELQLDHMRRMLRSTKAERSSFLKQQVAMETSKSADHRKDAPSDLAHLEKLDRLEQEYLRLTHTQNNAEIKIRDLELKLQEEEHQRKLVQDKANLLQVSLETNRILLQSVSPRLSSRQYKDKKSSSKKSSPQQMSCTEPHYKLCLRDVPFVAGKSVGCSHSVSANVQSVLSLLKQHQPRLCSSHVLCKNSDSPETSSRSHSSSSSSSSSDEELSDVLQALHEELRLLSLEQDELRRQMEDSVSGQERNAIQRQQERLLLKMERKGEQISKVYRHRAQMKKLWKERNTRRHRKNEVRVTTTTVSTRGHCAAPGRLKPGERSKRNLRLLRDMKALQTSLQT